MKHFFTGALILSALIFLAPACRKSGNNSSSGSGSGTPGKNEVFMQNNMFNPTSITVSVNTTVKWTNKDDVAHTVTGTSFDSGTINAGGSFSHQFTSAGTFPYRCTIHSMMTGTVVVQ